ncbi:MAG: response regulator transcription factor [Atopococcus tabaci]|uniref:Response regulator transcription factor n=1 Tax=Atopococcus tabaci TaxID=269774 RepID=A0AA43UCF0_9LACT|nr:response regulator transcription factor [Atopococcus tabaci]
MKRVLIVDDEQSIITLLTFNLEKQGYKVDAAMDGKSAFQMALNGNYDFIILDLMLPGKNGMDVCRDLRKERVETPILMLTAKDDEFDKVIGLELGADDYMTKPFSPRELIARMNAVFRRSGIDELKNDNDDDEYENSVVKVGEISIFPNKYEVYKGDQLIDLTPKEFELLHFLAEQKNRIINRAQLLNAIWNYDYIGGTRIVDVHISHLREKLEEDSKDPKYIQTIRGFGYSLKEPEK